MPGLFGALGGASQGASAGFSLGGPWGAVAGGVIGGVLGALGNTPEFKPKKYTPASVTEGQGQFMQQAEGLPGVSKVLQDANRIDNASYQRDASEFAPNLMGNIAQQGENNAALLSGNLTPGVQAALGKPGATARDLGLTSDQLMLAGAGNLGGELKTAIGLNPFNETSTDTLISPSALLKRQDSYDLRNNQIANQQRMINFGESNSNLPSSILSGIGSLAGSLRGYGFGGSYGADNFASNGQIYGTVDGFNRDQYGDYGPLTSGYGYG